MRCFSVPILVCILTSFGGSALAQTGPEGPVDAGSPVEAEGTDTQDAAAADAPAVPVAPPGSDESRAAPPPDGAVPPAGGGSQPGPEPAPPREADPSPGPGPAPGPPEDLTVPSPEDAAGTVPSPAEMNQRLSEGFSDYDGVDTWTAPVPVLALDGYMRMRGELMDTFWLGRPTHESILEGAGDRDALSAGLGPDPFSRYRSLERREPNLDCVDEGQTDDGNLCDIGTLQNANMRLRLSPQLNITEDVRVRTTFDVLDNVVAGDRPQSFYGMSSGDSYENTFADTLAPGRGLGDTIVVRRAWAEVRNRDLGELRFGRMPQHWGLGMRYNSGNGLDHDFSTDLDRVMAVTKLAGFYFTAAYDFLAEGLSAQTLTGSLNDSQFDRPAYDGSQLDDMDQFSFSVARLLTDEEEKERLTAGDTVFNGGIHFEWRKQAALYVEQGAEPLLRPIRFNRYVPDVWLQLKLPGVRLETEAAWAFGSLTDPLVETGEELSLNQLGVAFESEFRFLNDKLAVYFYAGFASGDSDVEGLSANADFVTQLEGSGGDSITTYSFHPSYQVDMILWRNIMRQVSGAYYFKPSLSYDFVRNDFGELFGAKLDLIWSRASAFLQTPGNDPNLGVEFNAQIYWRSEDGADIHDGYHAALQYGVLFPLAGLGFPDYEVLPELPDLEVAQQLRLILGVAF